MNPQKKQTLATKVVHYNSKFLVSLSSKKDCLRIHCMNMKKMGINTFACIALLAMSFSLTFASDPSPLIHHSMGKHVKVLIFIVIKVGITFCCNLFYLFFNNTVLINAICNFTPFHAPFVQSPLL